MPSAIPVPTYRRQVADQQAPGFRQRLSITPEDFGAGIAAGAERLGRAAIAQVKKSGEAEEDKQQRAVQMDAYNQLGDVYLNLRRDLRSNRGANAMQASDRVVKEYDEQTKAIRDTIIDGRARAAFDKMNIRQRKQFLDFNFKHTAQQGDVLAAESASGAISTATQLAMEAATSGDFEEMREHTDAGRDAVRAHTKSLGIPVEKSMLAYTTEHHAAIINSMLDVGAEFEAQKYLEQFVDEIDAKSRPKIERIVSGAVIEVEAAQRGDDAWFASMERTEMIDGVERKVTPDGNLADAIESIRALGLDKEEEDAAIKRATHTAGVASSARIASDTPLTGRLWLHYETTGSDGTRTRFFAELTPIGQGQWLHRMAAERRSRRDASASTRRIQAEINALARAELKALDLYGTDGEDQRTIDIDNDIRFRNVDRKGHLALVADQKSVGRRYDKTGGISEANFMKTINSDLANVKVLQKEEFGLSYKIAMIDLYNAYQDNPDNINAPEPPPELVDLWRGLSMTQGEETTGFFYKTNMSNLKAQRLGIPLSVEGFPVNEESYTEARIDQATKDRIFAALASERALVENKKSDRLVPITKKDGTTGHIPYNRLEAFRAAHPEATIHDAE